MLRQIHSDHKYIMTSKVLMKLPTVPFSQGKKSQELVILPGKNEAPIQFKQSTTIIDKTAQLEQSIKFLQEQHQMTLAALHEEVEILRQRNKDLQFQLVFSKGVPNTPITPCSPEDNGNGFAKSKSSPIIVNDTPLQIELLEKDLLDLKVSLQEAKKQNQYLKDILECQKIKLDTVEKSKVETVEIGIQMNERLDPVQVSLTERLEDAEALIRRLRRETADQKREIANLKSAPNIGTGNKGGRSRDGNNEHHSRGSPTDAGPEQSLHKFPPLQTQSYWHRSFDYNNYHRNGRSRHERQQIEQTSDGDGTVLPQLCSSVRSAKSEKVMFESPPYRSRGYHNYFRDSGNRKYRGQVSQRERRDPENRYHRRDYKDRNSKDHQKETGEGSRDSENQQQ